MNTNYKNILESQAYFLGFRTLEISRCIFDDIEEFAFWSGSGRPKHHHYGDYGLARHTKEVIDLMFAANKTLRLNLSEENMFVAGLYHDIGKVWDYGINGKNLLGDNTWTKTNHAREIHHISRSALVWSEAVNKTGVFVTEHDEILHAILAHHGCQEYGSPVAPKSKLAHLLHHCDAISARMDDWDKRDVIEYNS